MKRVLWVCGGAVIGAAQVAGAGDGADGSAEVAAPLGSISLNLPSRSLGSGSAIGEAGPRDNWGVYVRGAGLLTTYREADFTPSEGEERSVDFDTNVGFSGAIGYRFWNFASSDSRGTGFRVEAEVTYERANADDDAPDGLKKLELLGFAANGYFDLAFARQWTWYIGGGVGIATDARGSGSDLGQTDDPLFAQVMSGFTYTWGGPLSVYGGLRVRGYQEMESDDSSAELDDFASGSLEWGVIISF